MTLRVWWTVLLSAAVLASCALHGDRVAAGSGHLHPQSLTCEHLTNPMGLHEAKPRLTWTLASDRRAERQSAYRVIVASSMRHLDRGEGDLWDSGVVGSADSTLIEYAGEPLTSRQACFWKVRAWDRDNDPGPWSAPASFEIGLLSPSDWKAEWIEAGPRVVPVEIVRASYSTIDGSESRDVTAAVADLATKGQRIVASNDVLGGDPAFGKRKQLTIEYRRDGTTLNTTVPENATAMLMNEHIPYLRRSFNVKRTVERARLYTTALGVYEVMLNGSRVGDEHLAPGWTDYRRRVRYQTFDVTDSIAQGTNVLGAIVAPGWFSGRAGLFHIREFYGTTPAFLAQLEIRYDDGSTDTILSDGTWQRHDGPLLAADMMDGEFHDARSEIEDWSKASTTSGLASTGWTPVANRAESRTLEGLIDAPVRVLEELPAISRTEPASGRWTFDLGQNMVGVARLRVAAPRGTVVTIRYGEMLNPDGTLYTANLRGAACVDTYICRGSEHGIEEWQPRFTFHGFRYVEVTGLDEAPPLDAITGVVLGSDLPIVGDFACSDARLNQLQSNILWGLRGNYLSIPTDCPQRDERMGWMADTQVFVPTAVYNADVSAFMDKWMIDVRDAQRDDGAHSDVAPVTKGLTFGTPAWADAGTIVPWTIYQAYGDARILERNIESMTKWVEWCRSHSTSLIRDKDRGNDYGDWLAIGADTPKDLIGTAYFARSADILSRSLRALGRNADADRYAQLFAEIRAAFISKYVSADGHVAGETQCGYALALRFNLLPEELRERALALLVADIEAKNYHVSTGFVGVGILLPVLSDMGRADVAMRLLVQDSYPSWLYSVKHGATTIWERWDGWTLERGPHPDIGMNSFNHYSLGSCGEWMFEGVAGIALDPASPGFKHVLIRPRVDLASSNPPLTNARATYRSIRGEIASAWTLDADHFTLRVTIPANTTATLFVPTVQSGVVLESGMDIATAEGVRALREEGGSMVLEVGSGTYEFTSGIRRP